jgi:hypothetical protein
MWLRLVFAMSLTLMKVNALTNDEGHEIHNNPNKRGGNEIDVPGLFYNFNHQELLNLAKTAERNLKFFIYAVPDEISVPQSHFNLEYTFPHYLYGLHDLFKSDDPRYNMLVTNPEEANAFLIDCRWIAHVHKRPSGEQDATVSYLIPIVNKVINDYPYFNRTMGADHFLIQMFDNGPFGNMVGLPNGDDLFHSTMRRLANTNFIGNYGMDLETFGNEPPKHRPGKDIVIPQPIRPTRFNELRKLEVIRNREYDSFFTGSTWGDRGYLFHMAKDAVFSYYFNGTEDFAYGRYGDISLMTMSYFSYNACGLGCWSQRLYHSMTEFTIPIIVGDGIVQAFEKFIDWKKFSLKMSTKTWHDKYLRTAYRREIRKHSDQWRQAMDTYARDPSHYTTLRARTGSVDFEHVGRVHHEVFLDPNHNHEEEFAKTLIWKKWQALAQVWYWFDLEKPEKEINAYRLLTLEIWCRIETLQKEQGKRATVQEACLRPSDRSARQEWTT